MTTRIEAGIATLADGGFVRSAALARSCRLRFGHVPSTGSTNADLAAEARAGDTEQAVLVADHQTAGRGRLNRSWIDRAGRDLLVSFRLRVHGRPHEPVAAVAAALRWAAAQLVTSPVGFKWPNDLVVHSGAHPGKLAGILAEYVACDPAVVIVGCGLNIAAAPALEESGDGPRPCPVHEAGPAGGAGPVSGATSIMAVGVRGAEAHRAASGAALRDPLLSAAIAGLVRRLEDPAGTAAELRAHSTTLGRRVRVELGEGRILAGTATDIDPQGRLVVEHSAGRSVVGAGDVAHLRLDGEVPGIGL